MIVDPRPDDRAGAALGGCPGSLSILGWALDEEMNVTAYIERIERFLSSVASDYELILIDDGSTDRTWEIAQECARTRPWVRLFQNDRNRGGGYCTKRGIELATKDYLLWQTVDWSYDISGLGRSLHLLDRYDVLQGFRPDTLSMKGLRRRSDNRSKAIISAVNYGIIRLLFGLPVRDYQNVTVYPRRLIQSVNLESESAFTNPECLLKVWWRGATIKEIEVPFIRRTKGVAKGTRPLAVLAAIEDIFTWWIRWVVLDRTAVRKRGRVVPDGKEIVLG